MGCLSHIVVLVLTFGTQGSDEHSVDVDQKLREIVDQNCLGVGQIERQAYKDKLLKAISLAPANSLKVQILDRLPTAMHSTFMPIDFHLSRAEEVSHFQEFRTEGYGVQVEFLSSRIARFLEAEMSGNRSAAVASQIEWLCERGSQALKQKLLGNEAATFIDRTFTELRDNWKRSLSDPFTSFLIAPLSEIEMLALARRFTEVIEGPVPRLVTAKDLSDTKSREKIDIDELVNEVRGVVESVRATDESCSRHQTDEIRWIEKLHFEIDKTLVTHQPLKVAEPVARKGIPNSRSDRASPYPDQLLPRTDFRVFEKERVSSGEDAASRKTVSLLILAGISLCAIAATLFYVRRRSATARRSGAA